MTALELKADKTLEEQYAIVDEIMAPILSQEKSLNCLVAGTRLQINSLNEEILIPIPFFVKNLIIAP